MTGGMAEPPGMRKRRALSVAGHGAEAKREGWTSESNYALRETFSTEDARAAMDIDWLPMKYLSQAIRPPYATWLGREALDYLGLAANRAEE